MSKSKTGPGQKSQASLRIAAEIHRLKETIANDKNVVAIAANLQQLKVYEDAAAHADKIDDELFGMEEPTE